MIETTNSLKQLVPSIKKLCKNNPACLALSRLHLVHEVTVSITTAIFSIPAPESSVQ